MIRALDYLLPIVRRMQIEQLEAIRLDPAAILDLGPIPAAEGVGDALSRRYPKAQRIFADPSSPSLAASDAPAPHLSLSSSTELADLLIATLPLPLPSPLPSPDVLRACRRALRPGGLMMLAALGDGSLDLLAQVASIAGEEEDAVLGGSPPPSPPEPPSARKEKALREELQRLRIAVDMQRLGDALFEAGFADVVADVERFSLDEAQASDLMRIMRGSSGSTVASSSAGEGDRGLPSASQAAPLSVSGRSVSGRSVSGKVEGDAMMEIVFVHARCPQAQSPRERPNRGVVFPEFR
ncbi:MAG: hypothetical protein ISN28_11170 [Ectothiorhodospiraceae bacterium AqS1]|nr:hypothetical protein [Ectothiorhodospiraceae bacterium AqS1]